MLWDADVVAAIGVGWAMMLMSFVVAIYYNMIIAYILRYLFASFTTTLPWQSCRPEWIQYGCYERLQGVPNATDANTTLFNATSACRPMIFTHYTTLARFPSTIPTMCFNPLMHKVAKMVM